MLKTLLSITLLLLCFYANAQDTLHQFLSYSRDKASAETGYYYRVAGKHGTLWNVKDYYVAEKSLALDGTFSDDSMKNKVGTFYEYYPNRQMKSKGRYVNGKKNGAWKEFHENGRIADSAFFKDDIPFIAHYKWDKEGNLIFKGIYDEEGKGTGSETILYPDGSLDTYGITSEGHKKDSTWTYFYENGNISYKEHYNKGTLSDSECFDENGQQQAKCDSMSYAEFDGNVNTYLGQNIVYPKKYVGADIPVVRLVVRFAVGKDGQVSDVEIVQRSYGDFNNELKRVISSMPKWLPAKDHNRPAKVYFTLPMTFRQE